MTNRNCVECGRPFKTRRYNAEHCGGACRRVFNNRRALRGAVLYDLTMIETAELSAGKTEDAKATRGRIEAAVAAWKAEDASYGRGRSWQRKYNVMTSTLKYAAERSR